MKVLSNYAMTSENISNLRYWQDVEYNKKIQKLLDDDILTDCKFLVGPDEETAETINGHKLMFVLESPVFEKMFTGVFAEAKNDHVVRISDIFPCDFKNLRYLIYHNNYSKYPKLSLEEIFKIYHIADKYLISSVMRRCIKVLETTLVNSAIDRIISILAFASSIRDVNLLHLVKSEILTRKSKSAVLHEKLNDLSPKVFYDYILLTYELQQQNKSQVVYQQSHANYDLQKADNVTPLSVFKAIESYFEHNHLNPRERKSCNEDEKKNEESGESCEKLDYFDDIFHFKKSILKLVKFDVMTRKEFIDGPGKSEFLEVQEKYNYLVSTN